MKETGTRIEITAELNQLLNDQISEFKSNGNKEINKKILVEQLCKAGLAYQKQEIQEGSAKGISGNTGVLYPSLQRSNEVILESKGELEALREAIKLKESEILLREKHLDSREKLINEKYEFILKDKEEMYDIKYKHIEDSVMNKANEKRIEDLEKENSNLRSDNHQLQRDIKFQLKNIERNTESDTLKDDILPLVTTGMLGFLIYLHMTNKKTGAKINPVIKQYFETLSGLPEAERVKMIKEVIKVIKKYAEKK